MTELTKLVIDATTGEETIIPLTPEEVENFEAHQAAMAELSKTRAEEDAARQAAKASAEAKLAALGLTAEEIAAL